MKYFTKNRRKNVDIMKNLILWRTWIEILFMFSIQYFTRETGLGKISKMLVVHRRCGRFPYLKKLRKKCFIFFDSWLSLIAHVDLWVESYRVNLWFLGEPSPNLSQATSTNTPCFWTLWVVRISSSGHYSLSCDTYIEEVCGK